MNRMLSPVDVDPRHDRCRSRSARRRSMRIGTRAAHAFDDPDEVDASGPAPACSRRPGRCPRGCPTRSRARACRRGTARRLARPPAAGASSQRPLPSSPRSAAKHAPESKRGTHSQSIDPSSATRPAVWVSPMRAYCSIARASLVWDDTSTKARRSWVTASRSASWCGARRSPRASTRAPRASMARPASTSRGSVGLPSGPGSGMRWITASCWRPMAWLATMSATGMAASSARARSSSS